MSSVQTGRSVASSPVPQPRPGTPPPAESYTVKSGDSLWNIAKDKYGDGMKWKDIYADNKDIIGQNPDLIHPGMQLQLRGTQAAQAAEEAPAATATPTTNAPPEVPEAPETTDEGPVVHNEVANVPTGSAAPSVDLFEEEAEALPANTLPADIHPEVVEEPAVTVPEEAPTILDTPAAPEAPTPPTVTVQSESPAVPEAPTSESTPLVMPTEDTAPVTGAAPSAPDHPTISEAPPIVDSESFNPAQAQAEAILNTIDGKGYTVAHHGDPVGGIPKVVKAMDDVLAMSAGGEIDKLPDGATKDKMNQWAQDIVSGRLAQAGRQFDGVTERTTTKVNDLVNHPAFGQLPEAQQDRLLNGLQSGFEMMGYLPVERLSEGAQQLQSQLSEHFGAPAQAAPTVESAAPQMPSAPTAADQPPVSPAPSAVSQAASPQAAPAAPQAPTVPTAESAPTVDTTPANPELDRASAVLKTIDGKGYTVAHHGDPVGGIPKVVKAMDDALAMSAGGEIDKLPDGATKDKMNQWAQDIVSGRLAQAGRQFDGVTERTTAKVNDLINHPAFTQLPEAQQERLLNGLQSGFEMMSYLPAERLSEGAQQLQSQLAEHFGAPAQVAPSEAVPSQAPAAQSFTLDEFKNTLQEKVGLFGKGEHQSKLLTQGQALAAVSSEQHQEVSQLLSDAREYSALAKILEQSNDAAIAATLTHPDIRGIKVIEAAEDKIAGQLLTALANQKEVSVGAEDIIASTLEAFDGVFNDREAPFEALMQSQAFEKLTADLQARIKDLVKYW